MSNRFAYVRRLGMLVLQGVVVGCAAASGTGGGNGNSGTTASAASATAGADPDASAAKHLAVEMPSEAAEVRTNASAPILSVVTSDDVVFAYVYGYPLYPEGDAARGIQELRKASAEGAKHSKSSDRDGVVHVVEELPAIACRFEGIREDKRTFVPVSLTCDLPAPSALGGAKRPVLGAIAAGAKAEEILKEPTVVENFLGAFHLTSDDFAAGSGTGFFNTTHGQIAFVFKQQKLDHFVYFFDPGVRGWREPKSWEGVL